MPLPPSAGKLDPSMMQEVTNFAISMSTFGDTAMACDVGTAQKVGVGTAVISAVFLRWEWPWPERSPELVR